MTHEPTERLLRAYASATVSRGKRKGLLLASCPAMGSDAAILWQCVQIVSNPYKVSIGQTLFCQDREFREECLQWVESRKADLTLLDRDRLALETLGVW